MSYIEWIMKGVKIAACSCDYGCPCEFNAAPTRTPLHEGGGIAQGIIDESASEAQRDAEMASATAKGTGDIKFDFAGRYAFLIDVTYGPQGIVG